MIEVPPGASPSVSALPLEQEVQLLRTMLDSGPCSTLVIGLDLRVIASNALSQSTWMRGVGRAPARGENILDLLPREHRATLFEAMKQAEAGAATTFEQRFEHPAQGSRVVEVCVTPVRSKAGDVIGACFTSWAIDHQKRAERALRASEEQLRTAMEAGHVVLWEWDIVRDEISSALGMPVFGPTPKDVEAFLAGIFAEDRPLVEAAIKATLERDVPYVVAYRKTLCGTMRWLESRAELRRDASGKPAKMVGVVVDATERRRLEEQLAQAAKMEAIGRLAGGVAHDFNNLLAAITASAEVVLQRHQAAAEPIGEILEASTRAAALTQRLLAFSRQQALVPIAVDLNAILRDMLPIVRRLVGEVSVVTDFGSDLNWVRGEATPLEQVILNLLVNARDAMPEGGSVHVSTRNVELSETEGARLNVAAGAYARLRVVDSGVGIDSATKARIFEPFFTTKRAGAGTGLGLSTAYGIVVQLGGAIVVESTPGQGATFDVLLPKI
jgi:signal transduction histidine kinase